MPPRQLTLIPDLRMSIPRKRLDVSRQPCHNLPTHSILLPPPPEPPDMPIGSMPLSNKPPGIEDEPINVHAIDPELNADFEENIQQQDDMVSKFY